MKKRAIDPQLEQMRLEERTRRLAITRIQAHVRRKQVQKAMPTLRPTLNEEKQSRAAQRRLDAWRRERRRSEQPGFASISPRKTDALMRHGLKSTTMSDALPTPQLLPAYTASKLLPSLDAKPRRSRRSSIASFSTAIGSSPLGVSPVGVSPVGGSPLGGSPLGGRSASAPMSRPAAGPDTPASSFKSLRAPSGGRSTARSIESTTSDRLAELSDPKVRGYVEGCIEYQSRQSLKEPATPTGACYRAPSALSSSSYRRPSKKSPPFLFSGNLSPSSRDNALKVTGKHSNVNQIGPASVPLYDLLAPSIPEATPSTQQQALAPRSTSPPSLMWIPRSEGNACGLAPKPTDRELVQSVIAAHQQRYSPLPVRNGRERRGSRSPLLHESSPSMLRPSTEDGSQCLMEAALLW